MTSTSAAETNSPSQTPQPAYLMKKLPVETRLDIFRLVLHTDSEYIIPLARDRSYPGKFDTALFAVSHQISAEAQDVFFERVTVIINNLDIRSRSIPYFRNIEVRPAPTAAAWPAHIVKRCTSKLKKIVLARENLSFTSTIREFFESHRINVTMRAVKLGVFEVRPADCPERQILVKNFEMVEYLPLASTEADRLGVDMLEDVCYGGVRLFRGDEPRQPYLLAFWLAAYDLYVRGDRALEPPGCWRERRTWRHRFLRFGGSEMLPPESMLLPSQVKLQDLTVASHGSELVEWATELIGAHFRRIVKEDSVMSCSTL